MGGNNPMYGKKGTWLGKKFTQEHKKHISESLKGKNTGKLLGSKNPSSKKVINLTTGDIFDTIKSAESKYNIPNKVLNSVLKKKHKVYKDHYWDYLDNINNKDFELKSVDIDKKHKKKVMCKTTSRIYVYQRQQENLVVIEKI